LKKRKVKNIIVAGVLGEGCVNATIQSGFSKGYAVTILKDLIETMDNNGKQELLRLLKKYSWSQLYRKTITSKQLLRAI
jgi:nicotinamidase-related amidase